MVLKLWKVNLRRREPCNWRESVVSTENFSLWETRELMDGGYLWRSMWILCMTSSLSSHSTSATAVSSPKCNSEKRPLSNSVAFQTLFKWHRYCGILKIHIVRKINTGIRYEPVYRPALVTHTAVSSPKCNSEKRPLSNSVAFQTLFKWHRYCGILKIHIVRKINTGIRYEPVYRPALIELPRNLACSLSLRWRWSSESFSTHAQCNSERGTENMRLPASVLLQVKLFNSEKKSIWHQLSEEIWNRCIRLWYWSSPVSMP